MNASDPLKKVRPLHNLIKTKALEHYYHLLEISVTNAAVLKTWLCMAGGKKAHGVSRFRDELVLAIISKYGITAGGSPQSPDDFIIRRGSTPFVSSYRMICALCKQRCSRMCPDCPFSPRLCQSTQKDCHSRWHTTQYAVQWSQWFSQQRGRLHRGASRTSARKACRPA